MPRAKKPEPEPFVIDIDQQEKAPYTFACMVSRARLPFTTRTLHLKTGDYQAGDGSRPDDRIVIERKSLADLYSSYGNDRDREERKLARMSLFGFAALVIEAPWSQIACPLKFLNHPSALDPSSLIGTLLAWQQRYGVHVVTCEGRDCAERLTYRMLERWVRDRRASQPQPTPQLTGEFA